MNIHKLLSSKERVKILQNIVFKDKIFGVNEVAKQLNLSKGLVSKYFNILSKEGILKKGKKGFVVQNNSIVKSLKIMFSLQKINTKLFKKYGFIKAVGIYGSSVKGTNSEDSDVDMWIRVNNVKKEDRIKLSSELRKKIENIKVLFLDDKKIKILKKEDSLFYYSLYFGSIVIYGGEDEL